MDIGLRMGSVKVEQHNPEWETIARNTIEQLKKILKNTAVDIQHVGSTAIKNIRAKPIIDIVIGVSELDNILPFNEDLKANGFFFCGQIHPEQYLYVCGHDDFRSHHIHVVTYNSKIWNDYLNMRDYLNCHKDEAQAYSELKESLAKQYAKNRDTYTAKKSEFISSILQKAEIWRKGL
ncbi:MAG: GrpB family protein [Spirochaetaceae bacterium]|nr:GrpB family protein [Spirochaetaceae bacterium]